MRRMLHRNEIKAPLCFHSIKQWDEGDDPLNRPKLGPIHRSNPIHLNKKKKFKLEINTENT
ncbi:hypothetical protein Syun_009551 [Stephania yunnanensis]|uniref:Uncharacterized protein n=1 Tax=Stephania yunnanensis TaxID=152371 RepID=A0AAP0KEU8_9MAGN